MLNKSKIILGAIASALIGYAVFKFTGLCDVCETSSISNILGIIIVSICLYSYVIGLRRPIFGSIRAGAQKTDAQEKNISSLYNEIGTYVSPFREIEYVLHPNTAGRSFKGFLVDTTQSGVCLKTDNYLEEGQKVILKNMFPNECDIATVNWVKELEPAIYMTRLNCS